MSDAETSHDREESQESDRLHGYIAWILRIGLALSVLLFAAGLLVRLAAGTDGAPSVRPWHLEGDLGLVLSTLGVTVLAMTPAVRVLALVVLWWRERDWRFVAVALAVVFTLGVGAVLGKG